MVTKPLASCSVSLESLEMWPGYFSGCIYPAGWSETQRGAMRWNRVFSTSTRSTIFSTLVTTQATSSSFSTIWRLSTTAQCRAPQSCCWSPRSGCSGRFMHRRAFHPGSHAQNKSHGNSIATPASILCPGPGQSAEVFYVFDISQEHELPN